MGIKDEDDIFIKKTTSLLDDASENLDDKTRARLRQARRQALESAADHTPFNWMFPAGGFVGVATVAIVTLSIWTANPVEEEFTDALSDIELLTSTESLAFYEDLEVYAWLDEKDAKG